VTLFNKVKQGLEDCILPLNKICDQPHDKAAVLKGKGKELQHSYTINKYAEYRVIEKDGRDLKPL